jgi:hypothetical protein
MSELIDRKSRPPLCPCANSCQPVYNTLADDDRMKTGDLNEGYSGDCIGCGDKSVFVVGGQTHTNDMNHCVFTPLKGVIRFQVNREDVYGMLHMAQSVLHDLAEPPRVCSKCGARHRFTHWIRTGETLLCCRCYHQSSGIPVGTTEL